MYKRRKTVKGATYFQVVEGYRDDEGRVRHRTLASLGRHSTVKKAIAATRRDLRRYEREHDRERTPSGRARFARQIERARQKLAQLEGLEQEKV